MARKKSEKVLKSKIINMADKLKDNEDRILESMFRSDPVADNGFSARVMTRLNRRIWIRRLALPSAFVLGGVIAVKPLSQLVIAFSKFLTFIPNNFGLSLDSIPQASTILLGGLLLAAMMMITKMLEE